MKGKMGRALVISNSLRYNCAVVRAINCTRWSFEIMKSTIPVIEIVAACQTLFGPQVDISLNFLYYLQPSGAKAAFRKRALETHPDLLRSNKQELKQSSADQFRSAVESYELIRRFLEQREAGLWQPHENSCKTSCLRTTRGDNGCYHPLPDEIHLYHTGELPQRRLALGRYLYYRGEIPYHALLDSLRWQRAQRPSIGKLAKSCGWLNDSAVQAILRTTKVKGLFGEKAIMLGMLTSYQVKVLLFRQRSQQTRLGQYFARNGFITLQTLAIMLQDQRAHNASR